MQSTKTRTIISNCIAVVNNFIIIIPSDPTHLCDVVVNMVAVVLATPPFSNYLWYHLFAADKLEDVYATAFKVNIKFYNKFC